MPRATGFWRNVTLIGLAHVAVIAGLVRWSRQSNSTHSQGIVWINGEAGEGAGKTQSASVSKSRKAATLSAAVKPSKIEETEDEQPVFTSVKSDIQLPVSKPRPTPTISPKASQTPKPTLKPTPKQTPKPTPKPKKTVLAKASPKTSSKFKPAADETERRGEVNSEKSKIIKLALAKDNVAEMQDDSSEQPSKAVAAQNGTGKGTSSGDGGHGRGADGASEFGWYGSMLHDRFYSEWIQPTATMASGAKISALVKIRIDKDGRVSNFEMIRPSGNVAVDESIAAVAKRVTQVDPLPAGLGKGDHYDVRINFELNSE